MHPKAFRERLLRWYRRHRRDLPWRRTRDPYRIWISEIILQQTRVSQGLPYYESFIKKFPTLKSLAAAREQQVLKAWQGMGYYSRARNLHAAAREVVRNRNGEFPSDIEGIISMKGIWPYTAAAIGSIAFGIREPVLDGNVFRVLSRLYGIEAPIDEPASRKVFHACASALMKGCRNPGTLNEALMEFGALQCLPANPHCDTCPFSEVCVAFEKGRVKRYPVKGARRKPKDRHLHYLVARWNGQVVLQKRETRDIWRGLFEFPLLEGRGAAFTKAGMARVGLRVAGNVPPEIPEHTRLHKLTHQTLHVSFHELDLARQPELLKPNLRWVSLRRLHAYPLPRLISRYLGQA